MRQKSKIKTIIDAFSGKVDVTPEQWEYRLEKCGDCELNSINVDNRDLTLVEVSRKKLFPHKPFCRGCGCNIDEKTSQATEECGASYMGEPLRWNRLKLETTDNTSFNIYNQSDELVNIRLSEDGKFYEIDYGTIKRNTVVKIAFQIFVDDKDKLDIEYFKPSCGPCTTSTCEKVSDTHYNCEVILDTGKLGASPTFAKRIWVKYGINGSNYQRVKISLMGGAKIKKK